MRIEHIEELADVLGHSRLTTLEIETDDWSLLLERPLEKTTGAAVSAKAAQPITNDEPSDAELLSVEASIVGVFHGTPDVAKPGDEVRNGDLLGTIEALAIRNDVRAPASGEVYSVRVEDGQPVEFGQVLFKLRLPGGDK